MEFAQILRDEIVKKDLNCNRLSNMTNLSARLLQSYCEGDSKPGIDNLLKIADVLNVSVDHLLGRDESKKVPTIEAEDELYENISEENKQLDKQLILIFHKLNRDGKRSVMASAIGASLLPEYLDAEFEEAATQSIA